jgi:hypothetical protein
VHDIQGRAEYVADYLDDQGEVCNQFSCSNELLDPQSTVDDQADTVPSDFGALPAPILEPLGPLATSPAEVVS